MLGPVYRIEIFSDSSVRDHLKKLIGIMRRQCSTVAALTYTKPGWAVSASYSYRSAPLPVAP